MYHPYLDTLQATLTISLAHCFRSEAFENYAKRGSFVSSERIDSPTEQTINHTTNLTPFEENIQRNISRRITAGSDLFFQKIA